MLQPLITLSNIDKIYKLDNTELKVLDNVSLIINKGDFIAIMGPSGSGKSTLMHIIGLLDKPTNGEVVVDNENVEKLSETALAKVRNKKIGFVFQSFNLLPKTSSLNNVELTLLYSGVKEKERRQKALEMLEKVGLSEKTKNYPSQLSGGQQQRVAIARALINNPLIILADEPTGNLDSKSGNEIMQLFKDLNNTGHTIILVTHEPDIANQTKKIIRIKDGKII